MDESVEGGAPRRFGFRTYDDDTLRAGSDEDFAVLDDRPWVPTGDPDAPARDDDAPGAAPAFVDVAQRRSRSGGVVAAVLVGLGAAVGSGLLLWARQQPQPYPTATSTVTRPMGVVHIQVVEATPEPAAPAASAKPMAVASEAGPSGAVRIPRLEMLRVAASPAARVVERGPHPKPGPALALKAGSVDPLAPAVPTAVVRRAAHEPAEPMPDAPERIASEAPPRESRVRPALVRLPAPLDCANPASETQLMICGDQGLLEADRRMVRAYAKAEAAGAPPHVLWQEQVSWLNAREAAARRSPRDVQDLYRERIEDLAAEAEPPH